MVSTFIVRPHFQARGPGWRLKYPPVNDARAGQCAGLRSCAEDGLTTMALTGGFGKLVAYRRTDGAGVVTGPGGVADIGWAGLGWKR
jgi:hypothetical protein